MGVAVIKTSAAWLQEVPKEFRLQIYDPDGWDRTNFKHSFYEEEITKDEFKKRLMASTILCAPAVLVGKDW